MGKTSFIVKNSQTSTNGGDGITIDAYEPRLRLKNRRDTDETWQIAADNGNSSLQIKKDSQLVKAIFSPDDLHGCRIVLLEYEAPTIMDAILQK